MTPIANASLKAEYAAYCAAERARHFTPVSYELWLEGKAERLRQIEQRATARYHEEQRYQAKMDSIIKREGGRDLGWHKVRLNVLRDILGYTPEVGDDVHD